MKLILIIVAAILAIGTTGSITHAQELTLDDLTSSGVFRVKFDGKRVKTYFGKKTAVYQEVIHGTQTDGEWSTYTSDVVSDAPVTAITPKGKIVLPTVRLRLYLQPSIRRTFTSATASKAPAAWHYEISTMNEPIIVEEYRLEPRRNYYARVSTISYYLPPADAESAPTRHETNVLEVSDRPFKNGKPQAKGTPGTRSITH